ncbi:hypothetical protein [Pseudonocardia nigra]|uniref:hypothetical protein n=1 Tax=Pseudonocardia nigra TaxID=1921578 RepID=UPI001C5DA5BF|nr:hypothetical protein [Pseudonocardia nigra]
MRVLEDPEDPPACVATLTACHDLERGVVVCLPRPETGSRTRRGEDLLVALGKRPVAWSRRG